MERPRRLRKVSVGRGFGVNQRAGALPRRGARKRERVLLSSGGSAVLRGPLGL